MPRPGIVCWALLAVIIAAGPVAAAPSKFRQGELIYLLRQDCGSCHGMTLKGGLGPPLLPAAMAGKSDEALADVILYGLPGTPMPPWNIEISREEAVWLIRRMKEGIDDTP